MIYYFGFISLSSTIDCGSVFANAWFYCVQSYFVVTVLFYFASFVAKVYLINNCAIYSALNISHTQNAGDNWKTFKRSLLSRLPLHELYFINIGPHVYYTLCWLTDGWYLQICCFKLSKNVFTSCDAWKLTQKRPSTHCDLLRFLIQSYSITKYIFYAFCMTTL